MSVWLFSNVQRVIKQGASSSQNKCVHAMEFLRFFAFRRLFFRLGWFSENVNSRGIRSLQNGILRSKSSVSAEAEYRMLGDDPAHFLICIPFFSRFALASVHIDDLYK